MKRNAEKVATCFFLNGNKSKTTIVLHNTGDIKKDIKLKEEIFRTNK